MSAVQNLVAIISKIRQELQSHKKSFDSDGVRLWPVLIWHQMTLWRLLLSIFEMNFVCLFTLTLRCSVGYSVKHIFDRFHLQCQCPSSAYKIHAMALCHFWQNGLFLEGRVRNAIERVHHDVIQYVWWVTECHFSMYTTLFNQRRVQKFFEFFIPVAWFFSISFSDCFLTLSGRHVWKNFRSQDDGFLNACQATKWSVLPEKLVQQGHKS
jgi:hypothetical protein